MPTDDEIYARYVARFPRADRRDLVDAFEAAQLASKIKAAGPQMLATMRAAGVAPERIEAAELEIAAQCVEAEHAAEAALRRCAKA